MALPHRLLLPSGCRLGSVGIRLTSGFPESPDHGGVLALLTHTWFLNADGKRVRNACLDSSPGCIVPCRAQGLAR